MQSESLPILGLSMYLNGLSSVHSLKSLDNESVKRFILDWGNSYAAKGLIVIHDSYPPFFDAVSMKGDHSQQHIDYSVTTSCQASPSLPKPNVSECLEKKNSVICSLGTIPPAESSEKQHSADGITDAEGLYWLPSCLLLVFQSSSHMCAFFPGLLHQKQVPSPKLKRPDIKTQVLNLHNTHL